MKNILFLLELLISFENYSVKSAITYIEVKYPLKVSYEEYRLRLHLSICHLREIQIEDNLKAINPTM